MTKKSIRNIIIWALTLGFMTVIFIFSSQVKVSSDNSSSFVLELVNKIAHTHLSGNEEISLFGIYLSVTLIIRKLGHLTEYAILGILFFFGLYDIKKYYKRYIYAVLLSFLYASTDEFHQLFVSGRSGQIKDVFIDTAGAIIGITFVLIIERIIKKIINKAKTNKLDN